MTCPECGEISETVANGRCGACGHAFVFQPELDGTSDAEWLDLVRRASAGNTRYFTENQLYSRYARGRVQTTREISRRGGLGLALIVLGLAIWVCALKADWGLTLVAGVAVTLSGVWQVGTGVVTRREPTPREPITRWLAKWLAAKELPKLLQAPQLAHAGLELSPLRVECLVIVERDLVVDLLLKNDAHQQLSALIVSESGYPEQLAREARRLLDERSDLKVILLHDATQRGVELKSRVQTNATLPLAGRPLLDAGLFAAEVSQIEALTSAFPSGHTTQVPADALSYAALLAGLAGVTRGALSLAAGIFEAADARSAAADKERAA
jgi:hypothetical protein